MAVMARRVKIVAVALTAGPVAALIITGHPGPVRPLALAAAAVKHSGPGPGLAPPASRSAGPSAVPRTMPPGSRPPPEVPIINLAVEWPLDQLGAAKLWRRGEGAGVHVAVLDTGIDTEQLDVAGAIEHVDDLIAGSRGTGTDVSANSHGTAVAGIIAARGSVAEPGVMVGLAPLASLIDIRIAAQARPVGPDVTARGIVAAVTAGADVINVSLPVSADSAALRAAVADATAHQCVIVASAGSAGSAQVLADYPQVIVVAASTRHARPMAGRARAGPITIFAPGADLFSTGEVSRAHATGGYVRHIYGNAYAAAYASAAVALLLSADQRLTPSEAGRLLVRAAGPGPGRVGPRIIRPLTALALGGTGPARPTPRPSRSPRKTAVACGDHCPQSVASELEVPAALVTVLAVLATAGMLVRRRRTGGITPAGADYVPSSWDQSW
jgi:subtilisin family serine protease